MARASRHSVREVPTQRLRQIRVPVSAAAPRRAVLAIGGRVDAVHAASMLLLAAVSRAGRRAARPDALTEAAFAWVSCTRVTGGAGGVPVSGKRRLRVSSGGFRPVFPGQWIPVSLPVSQQRVLDGIESVLEDGEPRLGSLFAIFTRLTRDEGAPRTEALRAETLLRRARPAGGLTTTVRAIIAVPLILGLVTLLIFMAINTSGAHGCRPWPVPTRTVSCQSAQEPQGHS
jgi:hypothetical protein